MANWAGSTERFVEVPGVVEIRWVSDDPDYYVKPIDLFDQQATNEGLPDWYGKKDKATTEQAYFTCNVCECDLKSVVTLRAHCKGTQHIRKALQKKKEYRDAQKKMNKKEEIKDDKCKDLFECLEQLTSEAAVGLENITEYKSSSSSKPYYHCNLEGCHDDQGDCRQMMKHIMVNRHKQSWLKEKTGSAPQHISEINQKIAEYTKDYKRDYRLIKIVEDDELWRDCMKGKIRAERKREEQKDQGSCRRDEKERGSYDYKRGSKRRRSRSKEKSPIPSWSQHDDRHYSGRYRDEDNYSSRSRDTDSYSSRSRNDRETNYEKLNRREIKIDLDVIEIERPRSRDEWRNIYKKEERFSEEKDRERKRDGDREMKRYEDRYITRENGYWKPEEDDTECKIEYYRERDNEKKERRRDDVRESSGRESASSSKAKSLEDSRLESPGDAITDEIQTLHRKVADCVKKCLNKYMVGQPDILPQNKKIDDADDYTQLAKKFSYQMRALIKETYEQYEHTLEGITLTPDNKFYIETEIDMYFDRQPVIKR